MIKIVNQKITDGAVKEFLGDPFPDMIKFVVDVRKELIALGGELHSDAESLLLEKGSKQADLWGANYWPDKPLNEKIEYTSMINIRPSAGNRSMEVKDPATRQKIQNIAEKLLP